MGGPNIRETRPGNPEPVNKVSCVANARWVYICVGAVDLGVGLLLSFLLSFFLHAS